MSIILLIADAPGLPGSSGAPKWGLFTASGANALNPDNVKDFEFKQSWKIANYPLEAGAFSSYDKVITPFGIRLTVTKGGSEDERATFLLNAASVMGSLSLYSVVTPEITYNNVNPVDWRQRRTATNGVTLLTVEFDFVQLNITGSGTVTTTAAPSGAAQNNNGTVQGSAPTPSQSSSISNSGPPQPPETAIA